MARIILSLFIALFSYSAHGQIISEIEGRLSVHPAGDITSQMIGDTLSVAPSGDNNTFIGHRAGFESTGGSFQQTYIGSGAGQGATNGSLNTAVGYLSGSGLSSTSNSFFGAFSGKDASGSSNTYLGYFAGADVWGSDNVLIGNSAGPSTNSKLFSDRLYINNAASNYPLLYGEFDKGLLTIHHGADDGLASAAQGLRIQRRGTTLSWTQHIQSDGDLGFYYGGSGGTLMTLQPDGTLIISGDIIADNIPTMSQIQDLQEENKRLKSQVQELTQMVKELMPVESER